MKRMLKKIIPRWLMSSYHFLLAQLGALRYGFPSRGMTVIGVVGTRGKTTTANLIWSCLEAAGYKTGLTGTANIRIGEKEMLNPYHMTMPGRFILQKILREMRDAGCTYAVIETPSEGVEQWRHKGITYDVAVLTTLYPEYVEVHRWDFERCKRMHLKIFAELLHEPRKIIDGKPIPKVIVVNADNKEKDIFLRCKADRMITYGVKAGAEVTAENIRADGNGVSFEVRGEKYELNIQGRFNVSNALAAIAVVSALGIGADAIRRGLRNVTTVPGRMERIEAGQNFSVFVDYAHDPVSLEAALGAVRDTRKGGSEKTILLLGAEGGGRDKHKRPIMGRVAARETDYIVVSNVDPYDDDPKEILEDIGRAAEEGGKKRGTNLFVIEDRREGIRKALSLAGQHDTVLITGKGSEQSLIMRGGEIPWDDRFIVRQELEKIMKKQR